MLDLLKKPYFTVEYIAGLLGCDKALALALILHYCFNCLMGRVYLVTYYLDEPLFVTPIELGFPDMPENLKNELGYNFIFIFGEDLAK